VDPPDEHGERRGQLGRRPSYHSDLVPRERLPAHDGVKGATLRDHAVAASPAVLVVAMIELDGLPVGASPEDRNAGKPG
jgi:hypothetical protein